MTFVLLVVSFSDVDQGDAYAGTAGTLVAQGAQREASATTATNVPLTPEEYRAVPETHGPRPRHLTLQTILD